MNDWDNEGDNEVDPEVENEIVSFINNTDYPFEGTVEISVIPVGFNVLVAAIIRDSELKEEGLINNFPGPFFRLLLANGYNANRVNDSGNNYLHLLAREINELIDQREFAREEEYIDIYLDFTKKLIGLINGSDALLRVGLNPYDENDFGETPLDINDRILPEFRKYNRVYSTMIHGGGDISKIASIGGQRLYRFLNG